jgi:cytosine deaminase
MTRQILSNGRIQPSPHAAPERRDILVDEAGRIAALLGPDDAWPGGATAGIVMHDLRGRLVVPALVDAHQHLDKSHTLREVPNPSGTLDGAIKAFAQYARSLTKAQIAAHAERTIAACVARGTSAIRSHVNIDPECELRHIEALLEVRDRWRGRVDVQVVAFLTGNAPRVPEARGWLDSALAAGCDVIGGTPARATDQTAFYDILFAAAERTGKPIDVHLDEHLDPSNLHFDQLIARTRAAGMQGRVVASHTSVLSAMTLDDASRFIDGFAEAGIGAVTLPAANLFLQGRDAAKLPPRGLTRVNDLWKAGVTVACASDNIRDPFVPTGSGDMLEIARWTTLAAHLGSGDLGRAFDMACANPAKLMGLADDHGLRVGAKAHLLVTDAEDAIDLVAGGALERTVLHAGKVVAGRL